MKKKKLLSFLENQQFFHKNLSNFREEIQQSLSIIVNCISGAGSALPLRGGEPIHLVESLVNLTRFHNTAGIGNCGKYNLFTTQLCNLKASTCGLSGIQRVTTATQDTIIHLLYYLCTEISINGQNVRAMIAAQLRPLLGKFIAALQVWKFNRFIYF